MPDKRTPKLPTVERLTRAALHYLERYSSSQENLRKVLERRVLKACRVHERDPQDFADHIQAVIEKCLSAGLINDRIYAETKTASLRRRGGSRRKIEAQLSAKGVDRTTIEGVLNDDQHSDAEAARVYARRRRLGPFRNRADRNDRRDKDLAAMCRAGFSFAVSKAIVDGTAEDDGSN
ncbi:RecX family transcriptional regulator [Roseibium sp. HPY-6]|uniref:RecX family transcriptional regulator n=1 Tax=Roseibium sp. HPY-6 TaxID=3229852 RepID=UPI00338DEF7F